MLQRMIALCVHIPFAILTLTTTIVLVACGPECRPTAYQLTPLNQPGLTRIPQVAELQRHVAGRDVGSLTVYRSISAPDVTHIIFSYDAKLYDMHLDGSDLQALNTGCTERIIVDRTGHWGACRTPDDNGVFLRDMTTAVGMRTEQFLPLPSDLRIRGNFEWSPDGRFLAFLTQGDNHCSAEVYRAMLSKPAATLTPVAIVGLDQFQEELDGNLYCDIYGPSWSPDGASWLLNGPGFGFATVIALRPLGLTPQQLQRAHGTVTQTIPGSAVQVFGGVELTGIDYAIWDTVPNSLTYEARDGWTIEQLDINSGTTKTVLTQRVAGVYGITWVPGERSLAFFLGDSSFECKTPPAELYLFTPDSG